MRHRVVHLASDPQPLGVHPLPYTFLRVHERFPETIVELIESPEKRREFGDGAGQTARSYGIAVVAASWRRFIDELLSPGWREGPTPSPRVSC